MNRLCAIVLGMCVVACVVSTGVSQIQSTTPAAVPTPVEALQFVGAQAQQPDILRTSTSSMTVTIRLEANKGGDVFDEEKVQRQHVRISNLGPAEVTLFYHDGGDKDIDVPFDKSRYVYHQPGKGTKLRVKANGNESATCAIQLTDTADR